jgi:hypothetical protein
MPDESIWTRAVPQVADGDPVNAKITNASSVVLAERTAALKAMIDALTAGQQLVLRDAPLASNLASGTVVYFDPDTFEHDAATAIWKNLETDQAQIEPSQKAIYTGVIIDKSSAQVADILMSGIAELTNAQVTALFDSVPPVAGVYFLSSLVPGTVQTDVPAMRVRVLQYLGSNLIRVFPPTHDPITHTHKDFLLDEDDFEPVSFFDPNIVPVGATYGYDFTAPSAISQNLAEVLLPVVGEGTFVHTGVCAEAGLHVEPDLIFIDENGIWWTDSVAPPCDIVLTVTIADAKGLPILNTIRSLTPDNVQITVNNGKVDVTFLGFEIEEDNTGFLVVKEISGNLQKRGPVVEKVQAGDGMEVSPSSGQGTVTVTLSEFKDRLLDSGLINLNNAITVADDPYVFIKFPDNRVASVTLRVLLPNFQDDSIFEARIFAEFINVGSSQTPPTIDDIVLKPTPSTAGVTPPAPVSSTFPNFPALVTAGDVYLVESVVAFSLTGMSRGTIFYTLNADNPSPEFRLLTTGIRLALV